MRAADGSCPSCGAKLDFDTAVVLTLPLDDPARPWLHATSAVRCRACV